ncbi:hypothetical protein NKG05_20190 [Oerskovia sp. M15]
MLAPQTLAQHERILRADRDDEGQAGAEAGEEWREEVTPSTVGVGRRTVQRMIL